MVGREKGSAGRGVSDKTVARIVATGIVVFSVTAFLVPFLIVDTTNNGLKVSSSLEDHPRSFIISEQQNKKQKQPQSLPTLTYTASASASSSSYFHTHSTPYHTIFSSGCSTFQDWQSYVFFYHVMSSGQEGHVTRIASGCSGSKEEKDLQQIFSDEIESMAPGKHHLHLTPDYSNVKSNNDTSSKQLGPFKYFNKPFGVKHWMEHALGYPNNHALHDDSIIILLDPDQILIRPFTNDFALSSETWKLKEGYKLKVEHGSPFSQQYGYGLQWLRKVHPDYIFSGKPTPVTNMTFEEASAYYSAMG
jgi:hypothetical protein